MITKIEKFGAEWCAPCKALDKVLDKLSGITIVKHDLDQEPDLAETMKIRNIPLLIFYNEDNIEVERTVGAISGEVINNIINGNK